MLLTVDFLYTPPVVFGRPNTLVLSFRAHMLTRAVLPPHAMQCPILMSAINAHSLTVDLLCFLVVQCTCLQSFLDDDLILSSFRFGRAS